MPRHSNINSIRSPIKVQRRSRHGANDPKQSIAFGWLRASHRKLDEALSEPYRPYHAADEAPPLTPGVCSSELRQQTASI